MNCDSGQLREGEELAALAEQPQRGSPFLIDSARNFLAELGNLLSRSPIRRTELPAKQYRKRSHLIFTFPRNNDLRAHQKVT
jgi:hypothetical protein